MRKKVIFLSFIIIFLYICTKIVFSADNSLLIGMPNDAICLDPAVVSDEVSEQIISNIYETLVEIDPVQDKVLPKLAYNWYSNSNYTRWVFVLHEGIYFSDGAPFDAEAVRFSFLRQMDAKNFYHFPKYGYYSYYTAVFNGFPGILSKVNVLDKYKIEFVLDKPMPNLLEILSLPQFSIISPKAVKLYKDNFRINPVGTGPYKLASWNFTSRLILAINPYYWKRAPAIDRIIMQIIPNHDQRLSLVEKGYLDAAAGMDLNDYYKFKSSDKYRFIQYPYSFDVMLGINCNTPLFKDLKLREAVKYLLSKDITEQAGLFAPASGETNYKKAFYKIKKTNVNFIRAQKRLKEAKYDKKYELIFLCPESFPLYANQADLVFQKIAFLLKECGFSVKLKILPQDKFNYELVKGDYDLALLYTYLRNKDKSLFYLTYFDQLNPAKYNLNKFHYYTQDLKIIMNEIDSFNFNYSESYSLTQMNYYIEENIPYVFLGSLKSKIICSPKVNGLRFDNNNCLRFDKAYIK